MREQIAQRVGDGDAAPKAAILIRPRKLGVMSTVSRAV